MTRKKKAVAVQEPVDVKETPTPAVKAEEERLRNVSNLAILGERSINNASKLLAEASQLSMIGVRYNHNDATGNPTGKCALVFAYSGTTEQIQLIEKAISEALQ